MVVEYQDKAETGGIGSTCQRRDKPLFALLKVGDQRLQKLQGELLIGATQLLETCMDPTRVRLIS